MTPRPAPGQDVGRIVLWGTCDTGKPRVRILLQGLRENGVDVYECRSDPWRGIEDKSQLGGIAAWLRVAWRLLAAYPALAWRYLRAPPHRWVLLGYPSMPDIYVIRALAWLRGAKVAMDWFLSAYDTVVCDRKLVGRKHPAAVAIYAAEWLGIRMADALFMDTRTHARRMETLFGLPRGRCGSVWVGVETSAFAPPARPQSRRPGAALRVLFYGQFIPLHGIPTIVEAARLLRDAPVEWRLIGRGQEAPRVRAMLEADPLDSVRWLEWVAYEDLRMEIAEADICLGIFGNSAKAASVIPNKVFQIVAAGKPLITRSSDAIEELLGEGRPDVALVPAHDAATLAAAVEKWRHAPPPRDPERPGLVAAIEPAAIGRQLLALLQGGAA